MAKGLAGPEGKQFALKQYELRSVELLGFLKRHGHTVQAIVHSFAESLDFGEARRHELCIDEKAWAYVIDKGYPSHWVFCHNDFLANHPSTSLYYRGLTGLSQKAVGQLATSVGTWEDGSIHHIRNGSGVLKVACLYNTFISTLLNGNTDWVLENGYRTILATLGITFDGSFRNRIGQIAEERVRELLLAFVAEHELNVYELVEGQNPIVLKSGITMHFSSEPDVFFENEEESVVATIEVKGGLDPAGALERLGASQKSFLAATKHDAKCRTYLVAGVITPEMERRLQADRQFTEHFALVDILTDETARTTFLNEIFKYGLRYDV